MESPDYPPSHVDASRPSLGFPLGTALLIVIFRLSGIFSCCYHWDKLRYLRRRPQESHHNYDLESDIKANNMNKAGSNHQGQIQSLLPVLMPGDDAPKFIALPCPCQPPMSDHDNMTINFNNLQRHPPPTIKPPPPPAPRIAVPLY